MEAGKRIDDLLFITENLEQLLEQENAALRSKNLAVVRGLLDRKTTLSRAYEIRVFGMKQEQDRAEYDADDLANIERLNDVGARVAVLIVDNEKMLKVALEVSRSYMACVADAARQAVPGTGAYSPRGGATASTAAMKRQAPSLALDETL